MREILINVNDGIDMMISARQSLTPGTLVLSSINITWMINVALVISVNHEANSVLFIDYLDIPRSWNSPHDAECSCNIRTNSLSSFLTHGDTVLIP